MLPEDRWPLLAMGATLVAVALVTGLLRLPIAVAALPLPSSAQVLAWTMDLPGDLSLAASQSDQSDQSDRSDESDASSGLRPAGGSLDLGAVGSDGYRECRFTDDQGQSMSFLLHVPASYDSRRSYPLVLLLHGIGERAEAGMAPAAGLALLENASYVKAWVTETLDRDVPGVQARWPSFVVVPQLTSPNRWVDAEGRKGSYRQASQPTAGLQRARAIVDLLRKKYDAIDANRLYITGVSLGGYGTWDAVLRWPDYFAAAAPVAGAGDPTKAACLKDFPLWVFHGAEDPTVPATGSHDMVAAIRAVGGGLKWTEYAGAGHDIWSRVYAVNPADPAANLFQWLFAQRKADPHGSQVGGPAGSSG